MAAAGCNILTLVGGMQYPYARAGDAISSWLRRGCNILMAVERMQYPHGCSRVQHPQVYGRDAISLFRLKHIQSLRAFRRAGLCLQVEVTLGQFSICDFCVLFGIGSTLRLTFRTFSLGKRVRKAKSSISQKYNKKEGGTTANFQISTFAFFLTFR